MYTRLACLHLQVFFRLHVRFTTTVTRLLSPGVRKWMEYLSLAHAFALALVLVKLQSRFVNQKQHCLSRYFQSQGQGLQIEQPDLSNL